MADGLSVALAVIALVTALKDIKEVADQLRDSFSKLPENYKKAQEFMKEITDDFGAKEATFSKVSKGDIPYADEFMEDMNDGGELQKSLMELKDQIMAVHLKCKKLIPPEEKKRRDRYMRAWKLFWNRSNVEEQLAALEKSFRRALELFDSKTSMRTEIYVIKLLHETQRLDRSKAHASSAQLIPFPQPITSTPITWIPGTIPTHELPKAYLRRELESFDRSLQALSTHWFEHYPAHLDIPPARVSWHLELAPVSTAAMHQDAVSLFSELRTLVESPPPSWVHDSDDRLARLGAYFDEMQMQEEVISVGNLRIDLWRAMATVYPDSSAPEHLACALTSLSASLSGFGDKGQSQSVSEEVMNIIRANAGNLDGADMQNLIAQNTTLEAGDVPEPRRALQSAEVSAQQMEKVLEMNSPLQMTSSDHQGVPMSNFSDVVNEICANEAIHNHLFTYAIVLSRMSELQTKNDLFRDGNRNGKRTILILQHLLMKYPRSPRILRNLSSTLVYLSTSNPKLTELNTATENAEYTNTNADILTKLFEIDPNRYMLPLLSALVTKHKHLSSTGQTHLARKTHEQIISLRIRTSAIDEGKVPSETEGAYYLALAEYHLACARVADAKDAAQSAVTQYAALETMHLGLGENVARKRFAAAAFLCNCLAEMRQHDACLQQGFSALRLLDDSPLRADDEAIVGVHLELLGRMMEALDTTSDSRALQQARDVEFRIQKLLSATKNRPGPKNRQVPSKYASILQKNDLIDEAVQYLEGVLASWSDIYGSNTDHNFSVDVPRLKCLTALAGLYRIQGEIVLALKYSRKAKDITEESSSGECYKVRLEILIKHIDILCDAGRYNKALALSDVALGYAREHAQTSNDSSTGLILALVRSASCQLYCLKPEDAVSKATEALDLSQNALKTGNGTATANQRQASLQMSLIYLASGLADSGNIEQALLRLQEAKQSLRKGETTSSDEVCFDVHSHQVVASMEARLFLAKDKYHESASIIEGVIMQHRKSAKTRKFVVSALVQELTFAGIVYCALGQHEEGIRAAAEVVELKQGLVGSPGLLSLVEFEETWMARRGLWRCIQSAKDRLKCHHQDETLGHF